MSLATMLALVLCLLAVAPTSSDPQVRAGVSAFDELRYRDAVTLLERAAALPTLERDDQIIALGTLARAQAILKRQDEARTTFTRLLELEPTYLVGYDESPAVTQAFQAARAELERTHPGATMALFVAPPARPVWPWIVAGAGVAAAAVVTVLVVTHHGHQGPSGVNAVWQLP